MSRHSCCRYALAFSDNVGDAIATFSPAPRATSYLHLQGRLVAEGVGQQAMGLRRFGGDLGREAVEQLDEAEHLVYVEQPVADAGQRTRELPGDGRQWARARMHPPRSLGWDSGAIAERRSRATLQAAAPLGVSPPRRSRASPGTIGRRRRFGSAPARSRRAAPGCGRCAARSGRCRPRPIRVEQGSGSSCSFGPFAHRNHDVSLVSRST